MKLTLSPPAHSENGSALIVVMIFIIVMCACLAAVHSYTDGVARSTADAGEFVRAQAAAEAAIEVVVGRLSQWVTANGGFGPSIADCAAAGVPGNASFPAITSAITFPSTSKLNDYAVSTPLVYPVLPDDTVVTNTSDVRYLKNVSTRTSDPNQSEYSSSASNTTKYYFTRSAAQNVKNVAARSLTYKITVTVTPKVTTLKSSPPLTLTRFLRCDKISPFGWCTFRMGKGNYNTPATYSGPLYIANDAIFAGGVTFTDSVLYGGNVTDINSNWTGGGKAVQLKPTSLLSLIPNLVDTLATDSNGNRLASYENNTTLPGGGAPAPADIFSTRELIEPPTYPANDLTPAVIRDARIYTQADVRIKVSVSASKAVTKSLVNVDGTPYSPSWASQVLAAVNVKALADNDANAFIDRTRSTTSAIESTDIDVGVLKTVMEANPTAFPTGIIYAWDATGLSGGTRPLTGVRLWNAGDLPDGGLVVGSNDPIYIKGEFNTGSTLPSGYNINSTPAPSRLPPTSNGTVPVNSSPTTEAQRTVSGYTVQPAGVFGDSVTELSNAWKDANSRNSSNATSTTINLVEGWSTMSANELNDDDTYNDPSNRANPIWIENWSSARRTMSGEEFVAWHSKYGASTNEGVGGGWHGDISYSAKVSDPVALKMNWGTINFVRDRERRE